MKTVRLSVSVYVEVPDDTDPNHLSVTGKVFVWDKTTPAVEAQHYETDSAEVVNDD